ncbi:SRPBCC family protein [Ekhidna sp.]|uniref:SRPBCC family protein n=1 Tax=Ekhidna sp. TaxID=2608089 RepID=UPI003B5A8678
MELKTKIHAEDNKQDLKITREFELPLELLFKAYIEPELVEQWMGTKVLKLDNKDHGSYHFETTDPKGDVHVFHGTIHTFIPNEAITRTFEMEKTPFPVQLEFISFKPLTSKTSKLEIHIIYKSVEDRDNMLKLPFKQGVNMAHNKLEEIMQRSN